MTPPVRKDLAGHPASPGVDVTAAERLGAAVRQARRDARLTQQELAELAGTSDRTLRELEHGTGGPSLHTALEVCDVLGLRVDVTG